MDCRKSWYAVEASGTIKRASTIQDWGGPKRGGGLLALSSNAIKTNLVEGLRAAVNQGLAAGKLWIGSDRSEAQNNSPFISSGFCLGKDLFFTTSHCINGAKAEVGELLEDPKNSQVCIDVARQSKGLWPSQGITVLWIGRANKSLII
ncbi:MAG: hypothetical protein L6R38_002170 [Xanthoria sp. 2 TBL-2021]|nr:MAG: hypothetical protein L6R38_002170 [Xanthoria sp. 2 TBL-2021]